VLGLERLHYGLWDGEALDINGLIAAQRRYSELLHSWIPEGVSSILDVGAGVGTDARELSQAGYAVEGLSPDPYQQQKFTERTGLPFHLSRFQDLQSELTYDLILMSESAQYIWLESLLDKVHEFAPGGYLLVADYFLAERGGSRIFKSAHPLPEFLERARAAGFELLREEDVTERTLPTLDLARSWVDRYAQPSLGIVESSLASRRPWIHRLVWPRIDRSLHKHVLSREEFDSEEFGRTHRYVVMLFRVAA
jgi:MPBQ/MSBQ methyltransferase